MRTRWFAAAAAAGLLGFAGAQSADAAAPPSTQAVVLADGFETPVLIPGGISQFNAGQKIGIWTVTFGDVHLTDRGVWQATEGKQSLDLDGIHNGGVATTINTVPLVTYRIDFQLAGNPDAGPAIKTGQVRVNGVVVDSFDFDITGKSRSNMGYVNSSLFVITTASSINLEFASTTTPAGWGPVIDNVVVRSCTIIICG
jgi:choice-of-anchor C domain-containing protein